MGPGHAIYSRKSSFRCGWLSRREWDCVGELLGFTAGRVAPTRAQASQAVSASCHCNQNFCPPSGSDTYLQIRRAPRSDATWADVILTDWSNNVPFIPYRHQKRSACTRPWGHAAKCYGWSHGRDSRYRQPHLPEACCHWNFGARQVHGGSLEDHTMSRLCFVQDGPTESLHKCSGLDGADEEIVWYEGCPENHGKLALVGWLPCLYGHRGGRIWQWSIGSISSSVMSPDSNFTRKMAAL